jgi:hypothetical protein
MVVTKSPVEKGNRSCIIRVDDHQIETEKRQNRKLKKACVKEWITYVRHKRLCWRHRILLAADCRFKTKSDCFTEWTSVQACRRAEALTVAERVENSYDAYFKSLILSVVSFWHHYIHKTRVLHESVSKFREDRLKRETQSVFGRLRLNVKRHRVLRSDDRLDRLQLSLRIFRNKVLDFKNIKNKSKLLKYLSNRFYISNRMIDWRDRHLTKRMHAFRMHALISQWKLAVDRFQRIQVRINRGSLFRLLTAWYVLSTSVQCHSLTLIRRGMVGWKRERENSILGLFVSIWKKRADENRGIVNRRLMRMVLSGWLNRILGKKELIQKMNKMKNSKLIKLIKINYKNWKTIHKQYEKCKRFHITKCMQKCMHALFAHAKSDIRLDRVGSILSFRVFRRRGSVSLFGWIGVTLAVDRDNRRMGRVCRDMLVEWKSTIQYKNEKRLKIQNIGKFYEKKMKLKYLKLIEENKNNYKKIRNERIPNCQNSYRIKFLWNLWRNKIHPILQEKIRIRQKIQNFFSNQLLRKSVLGLYAYSEQKKLSRAAIQSVRNRFKQRRVETAMEDFISIMRNELLKNCNNRIKFKILQKIKLRKSMESWITKLRCISERLGEMNRRMLGLNFRKLYKNIKKNKNEDLKIYKILKLKFFNFIIESFSNSVRTRRIQVSQSRSVLSASILEWRSLLVKYHTAQEFRAARLNRVIAGVLEGWMTITDRESELKSRFAEIQFKIKITNFEIFFKFFENFKIFNEKLPEIPSLPTSIQSSPVASECGRGIYTPDPGASPPSEDEGRRDKLEKIDEKIKAITITLKLLKSKLDNP